MKRCTALRTSSLISPGFGCQPRRWRSYAKADLTPEALLRKVESGLGVDADGNPLRVDPVAKTVTTSVGDLPISPLFDPAWMKARRRERKSDVKLALGRFHKKLGNNPFARALATPLRKCPISNTILPRHFLQDFELVKHPSGESWWAPGPMSFDLIEPVVKYAVKNENTKALDGTPDGLKSADITPADEKPPAAPAKDPSTPYRPRRAPVTIYTLCSRSILDMMDKEPKRYPPRLVGARQGLAVTPQMRQAVWPQMSEAVLAMYRKKAVDTLIARANPRDELADKFMQACGSWEEAKTVYMRGCVLWLPKNRDTVNSQYATLDVENVVYGEKMAVHNLYYLLGEEEVERLRAGAEVFRDNELVVLRQRNTIKVLRLHMLLWRMQGFLAEPRQ